MLGGERVSTCEIACLGDDTNEAVLKSMLSVGYRSPDRSVLLSTGGYKQKVEMLDAAQLLHNKGYALYATQGTHDMLAENGIPSTLVFWPTDEGKQPQALDLLHERKIDMVVNINKNLTAGELTNGYRLRRAAIDLNIPLLTNARLASAFITAFCTLPIEDLQIKSWAEYK